MTFFLGLVLRHSAPWLLVVASAALLLVAGAAVAVRTAAGAVERRDRPAGLVRIAPRPPPGAGASVRFCRTAAVRLQQRDVVIVDSLGDERWLPREGAHRVSRLVRVLDNPDRTPLGVELRGPDDQVRAALPWRWWFGGESGQERWTELVGALGCPVDDRVVDKGRSWPKDPVAAADAVYLAPLPVKSARRVSRFPDSVLGGAGSLILGLASAFSLAAGLSVVGSRRTVGEVVAVLAGLALCGFVIPLVVHHLSSTLRLDRFAAGQDPQT